MKRIALLWPVSVATVSLLLSGCGAADLTLPGAPAGSLAVAVVQGDDQVGTVGEPLPVPVVVEVKTDAGQPMAGRVVVFVPGEDGASGFDPDSATTDAQGKAVTKWFLGTSPGVYTAEARVLAGGDSVPAPVALQATAGPGEPDSLRAVGSTIQGGHRGETLENPLVVMAVDRFGNPVAGAEIEWDTSNGSGAVSDSTTLTGTDGTASVTWTLGNRVGVQRATAELPQGKDAEVSFSATVLF